MKKILISFCCVLIFYNFTLNTFASVLPSDYKIQNEFDESIVLPVVYDNTSTYAMGGTIALGSLGLTTASGGAILGAAASVVGPILGAVALVGVVLVVDQGLVNIYDYVSNMGLLKEEADALNVSSIINKANGAMHFQLVPKKINGEPDIPDVKDPIYKDFGFPLLANLNKDKSSDDDVLYANFFKFDTTYLKSSTTHSSSNSLKNVTFTLKEDYYFYIPNATGYQNFEMLGDQIEVAYYPSKGDCYINFLASKYRSPSSATWTNGTAKRNLGYLNYDAYLSEISMYKIFSDYGITIIPSSIYNSLINTSENGTLFHNQTEFVIDKEVILNLNSGVEFNGSDYVDKNLGTVIQPDDLIIPMPDIMTDNEITYSPEVEEVIMPNGPTTDPLPDPNPNPDAGTGTGGSSDTETPPSEDQDKGFLESVKDFFLNLWDWLCNFWQNLLDLLMYLFNLFFGGLLDLLGLIVETVTNILNFLYELPSRFFNLFQELFVPSSDFFPSKFENILTGLTNKVPLFGQIKDFFTNLNLGGEGTPPKITITLPEFFGGETYDFIDFRFFEQYRSYYLNIVRVFMWIFALKHIYRRLPSVISGGGYL